MRRRGKDPACPQLQKLEMKIDTNLSANSCAGQQTAADSTS